ncbi:MAG TPA: hypothetical protein VK878_07355 [Candidatus Deferrimicrobiaceae bacterium]|nr:hypothetical protein [Candidatus Deferrimicrobiaceae bacterium]
MKRAATSLAVPLAIALVVAACASMQPGGPDLVARAVSAQGGADALANDSTVVSVTDVAAGATRNDWLRNFQYPAPRTFTFSEIVTPQAGYVAGVDSNGDYAPLAALEGK